MATLTIRQVDEPTHAALRIRAARHGRSVEAEVRAILAAATARPTSNVLIGLHQALGDAPALDLPTRGDRPREVDLG